MGRAPGNFSSPDEFRHKSYDSSDRRDSNQASQHCGEPQSRPSLFQLQRLAAPLPVLTSKEGLRV
jgi:hypothetical protein